MIGTGITEKRNLRCAIYTRVSDDEGLDQEFNSLDAQREAGEYHIKAQAHEGWRVLPERYDDGGYSAKDLNRPAAKRLLQDIKDGKIDVVVVYKIDRMSRNMSDFVELMKLFEQYKVTFVSVTQHFNTETAMGKLILNILQSFAQFEREMTAERIRDKFAASKMKGMWMGGPPPLGYDVVDRKLVVNAPEAKLVGHIFERFLALGSVTMLISELNGDGYTTKSYISRTNNPVGGKPFTMNSILTLLRNRLLVGDVHHKGKYYPGQHKPIIKREDFEKVQASFSENRYERRKRTWKIKSKALLKGILYCSACGGAMSPTHTHKKNKHYHYYQANSYRKQFCEQCPTNRIPAGEIEAIIISQLKAIFAAPQLLIEVWRKIRASDNNYSERDLHDSLQHLGSLWDALFPAEQKRIMHLLIDRVMVRADGIDVEYFANGFDNIVMQLQQSISSNTNERIAA